jgi:flagellin-like protein
MNKKNLKSNIRKPYPKKRRGVAEVISTLLLVAITVVGAVILTTFIDESFVSGSQAVVSGTDTTIKTIKLVSYDTRNGENLMGSVDYDLDNIFDTPDVPPNVLCRESCDGVPNESPTTGGSDFMIISIENKSVNPIYVKDVILDGVGHTWDSDTVNVDLNTGAPDSTGGAYPSDGQFSILSADTTIREQTDRQIESGATANLLIKLDTVNEDIQLSKTMRVQVNIGASSLADFLIETGDAR